MVDLVTAFQIFGLEWLFFAAALCAIGLVALIVGGLWMYRDSQSRRMDATVWLILLIVATLVGGIIGFVIVLVIYVVVRESHPIGGGIPYGYAPMPGVPGPPPMPAPCPVCGRPMTWYPQYQRWYCPSCGQYR